MSVALKKSNKLKYIGITGAFVICLSFVILNTFPHLKMKIYNYITGVKEEEIDSDPTVAQSYEEIDEVSVNAPRNIADESIVDIRE